MLTYDVVVHAGKKQKRYLTGASAYTMCWTDGAALALGDQTVTYASQFFSSYHNLIDQSVQ